ncbi:hypothetical protein [Mesonia aquimarina]|uniref:hypothetical protein n=1 Tax=Mesonia aquimarina TaxID=1504967 RepID=UPI0013CE5AE3|nr:hypothetical protein [Mesonia aquimarina]
MKNLLLILTLLLSTFMSFSQGRIDGFYKEKGDVSFVLGGGFEDSKDYFAGTDKKELSRDIYYTNLYFAYGILNDFDVSVSLPFIVSKNERSFQDISIFLKYRLYKKQFANSKLQFSIGGGFSTNVSDYNLGTLYDIGQQASIFESRALVHYKHNSGWFSTFQSGFSYKLEEVPNSFPLVFKVGRALPNWYYEAFYDYQYSFGGIDYLGTPPPQNFKEFGVNYHKVGATLYRTFTKNIGVYITYSYILKGRNVFQGPTYGLGLVYNLKTNNN